MREHTDLPQANTTRDAWAIVQTHEQVIARTVATAISRGLVARQDRDECVSDCTLQAYELAQRWDENTGPFENYLANSLRLTLLREGTSAQHEVDIAALPEVVIEAISATPADEPTTELDLARMIAERIPPRMRSIAIRAWLYKQSYGHIAYAEKCTLRHVRQVATWTRGKLMGQTKGEWKIGRKPAK
jgi:DNA-directed RNA polymerase specialized sigma24 family protein